jgi:hypothetical protein
VQEIHDFTVHDLSLLARRYPVGSPALGMAEFIAAHCFPFSMLLYA